MGKFYDVTFHVEQGKSVVKKQIYSELDSFNVWKDACEEVGAAELFLTINDEVHTILNRSHIIRVDIKEVDGPVDKQIKRRDELMDVVNTLSNMGF